MSSFRVQFETPSPDAQRAQHQNIVPVPDITRTPEMSNEVWGFTPPARRPRIPAHPGNPSTRGIDDAFIDKSRPLIAIRGKNSKAAEAASAQESK
jgi:hypothetical protein